MSTKAITIQNIKTGNRYVVDEVGLQAIRAKGMMSRFEVLEERVVGSGRTMIPAEIRQGVKAQVEAATKEQPTKTK
jgi:hypothetical protein